MSYPNGRIPHYALTAIPGGRLLSGTPARSWLAMHYYLKTKKGIDLRPTGPNSSYRTYDTQVQFWNEYQAGRGPIAARPGTSNHGWGKAVDTPTPAMHAAIRKWGADFGWGIAGNRLGSDAPSESWHSVYRGGDKLSPKARFWFWRRRRALKRKARRGK